MSNHRISNWKKELFSLSDEMKNLHSLISVSEKLNNDYRIFFENPFRKNKDGSLYYNFPYTEEKVIEREVQREVKQSIINDSKEETKSLLYHLFHHPLNSIKNLFNKKKENKSLENIIEDQVIESPIFEKIKILEERNYVQDVEGDKDFILDLVRDAEAANSFVLKKSTGEVLNETYNGPKIILYADSNIKINNGIENYGGLVDRICESSSCFSGDILGIISQESNNHQKKDISCLRESILGKNPFLRRCSLTESQKRSADKLFDILNQFYEREVSSINTYVERNTLGRSYYALKNVPEKLFNFFLTNSEDYLSESKTDHGFLKYLNKEDYQKWVAKTMMNICKNNGENYRADKILTSTTMALNLIDDKNKHIIIYADSDINFYMDIFSKEILPEYLSQSIIEILKENKRDPSLGYVRALSDIARGTLNMAMRESYNGENISLGLVYNPYNQGFNNVEIPRNFRNIFNNLHSEKSKNLVLEAYDHRNNGNLINLLFENTSN